MFLFVLALVYFVRYISLIQNIEKYMESNRPVEWEAMDKPSVFSGKFSEKNIKFRKFVDAESARANKDKQIVIMWERSKQLKHTLSVVTWSAVGMYIITIIAVKFLFVRLPGM
jgi:hypothetical protein